MEYNSLKNGGWEAKIILDSISEVGARLTTMEIRFPRIVLAEFNTHRVFSRNSASSRAIPVEKMIDRVLEEPFIPDYWGKNQKGMSAEEELGELESQEARGIWYDALDSMVAHVRQLVDLGVHKQLANRLLEPFMWHTVIVTATEWDNFFALRNSKEAQPEIRNVAALMESLYENNNPKLFRIGDWHLPYVYDEDWDAIQSEYGTRLATSVAKEVSVGRCARVSVLMHNGKRDITADLGLFGRLLSNRHMSPFEHQATPLEDSNKWSGNFKGWHQYRKDIPQESNAAEIPVALGV